MDMQAASNPSTALPNILKSVNEDMQACIQDCLACHQICEQMILYALERGSVYAWPNHIHAFRDCAAICALSADFLMRASDFHTRTCSICVEVCNACAENCERMADDEMMKTCAEICRRCAESCRQLGSYEH